MPRETYYGFLYRDFQKAKQDFGTIIAEVQVAPWLTLTNRVARGAFGARLHRHAAEQSDRDHGQSRLAEPLSGHRRARQVSDATFKFDTGPVKHTLVVGAEFSQEKVMRDTYAA